ncbi:MAG TPA: sensor histidine kinase [Micromonosporaceae bacterium]
MSATGNPAPPEHPRSVEQDAGVPGRPRHAWLWASVWLFYVYYPARDAWHETGARRVVGLAAVALFAATYVTAFATVPRPLRGTTRRRQALAVGLVVLGLVLAVLIVAVLGEANLAVFVYVAVLAMFLLPVRWGWVVVVTLLGGTYAGQLLIPGWHIEGSVQFQIFVAAVAMWAVTQIIARNRALAAAHQEIARLAAQEERNRLARDLHDILGHSLTVVAVKAELAGALVRRDPDRAETEIRDVERLARTALGEVRAAVAGNREISLAGELANARTALDAAGIDADLPSAIDDVPPERRQLFAWVVREGVTNVVRHSAASRCQVRVSPSTVCVWDDGGKASTVDVSAGGHGLAGLRERAEAAGGRLQVGRAPEGGFALTVSVGR